MEVSQTLRKYLFVLENGDLVSKQSNVSPSRVVLVEKHHLYFSLAGLKVDYNECARTRLCKTLVESEV